MAENGLPSSASSNGLGAADVDSLAHRFRRVNLAGGADVTRASPLLSVKSRRPAKLNASSGSDYLHVTANPEVVKLLTKQGDREVLFADKILKLNRNNRLVKRLLVISENAMYILEADTLRQKRRVSLLLIECLRVGDYELSDTFFAVIVPDEIDCMLASSRKNEIVTVLAEACRKRSGRELDVEFKNKFEYSIDPETTREVTFEEVEGGVLTKIINVT